MAVAEADISKLHPFTGPMKLCPSLKLSHGITAERLTQWIGLGEASAISGLDESVLRAGVRKNYMRSRANGGGETTITVFDSIFFRPPRHCGANDGEELSVCRTGIIVAEYKCDMCGADMTMRCTRRIDLERARG